MRVTVVVPALNAAATIERTLAALADQSLDDPYEVIVVDDGSTDATAALAARAGGPVRVLRSHGGGPGAARNRGAAESRGELLAFTDADCFPTADWLRAGTAALAGADLVQGCVLPDPAAPMRPFDRSLWVTGESGLYESANLLLRRELFERLGGFEDWFEAPTGKPLGEDAWLGWRARRVGARTAFCREALIHHAVLPRGPVDYILERRRCGYFAPMAARMPELRRAFFFGRVFLNRRSAAFDAALAAVALAALRRSPLPMVGVAPYAVTIARRSLQSGRLAPLVAPVEVAADAVGAASLVRHSLRHRTPVL